MENLISDLLWLSRIESVEGERKDDQLDLVDLLTNLCSELMAAWPDRQIELVTSSELCVLGRCSGVAQCHQQSDCECAEIQ